MKTDCWDLGALGAAWEDPSEIRFEEFEFPATILAMVGGIGGRFSMFQQRLWESETPSLLPLGSRFRESKMSEGVNLHIDDECERAAGAVVETSE